jgi:hypothetical protein
MFSLEARTGQGLREDAARLPDQLYGLCALRFFRDIGILKTFFFHLLLSLKMYGGNSQYPHDPEDHQAADCDNEYRHR